MSKEKACPQSCHNTFPLKCKTVLWPLIYGAENEMYFEGASTTSSVGHEYNFDHGSSFLIVPQTSTHSLL